MKSSARCAKCGHEGAPQKPSYENYHTALYSKPYRRTEQTDSQMSRIIKRLSIQPEEVVIDLGCGVGDYTKALRTYTRHIAGYDRDVTAAKRKYPGVNFFELDFAKSMPLPDSSVDKIVSINVIEHLSDWDFFLRECRRVLRPGGLVAFSTANKEFLLHDFHFDPTHMHEWTLDEFQKITKTYFQTIEITKDCAMFNYYPLNQILRFFLKPDITWIGRKSLDLDAG